MSKWEMTLGIVFGLLVNEITDVSPWLAKKLVRWSAYRWTTDPEAAETYSEEWAAIIEERPGKLLKLLTASKFALGAAGRAVPRAVRSNYVKARNALTRFTSKKIRRRRDPSRDATGRRHGDLHSFNVILPGGSTTTSTTTHTGLLRSFTLVDVSGYLKDVGLLEYPEDEERPGPLA
ncbi:hypothetical protein ACGFIR_21195 [Micromonospora sp. NPDC049051]|uniref:hypothetical protein n=1 Tax=Micromonospora sp. NPDC049051 TaxID=3364264 RepID=UPI003710494B